ncbi:MAG: DUF1622 domain-containing protein [Clostridia bacterium]|nr:DUF1622 domain-containing protein [Clostridia bacterium]
MANIAVQLKEFIYPFAEISASILEFIGIIIIIIGSFRALVRLFGHIIKKSQFSVVSELGKALSLALEFKMGAEIIKTVLIHNLEELAILGIVILIRALLSFIIHWEIHLEEKNKTKTSAKDN